jgi:hypothetical protein
VTQSSQPPADREAGFRCPICGWPGLHEPPRSPDGVGSQEICPCCFFQFGFDDDVEGISDEEWRRAWVDDGMPWRSKSHPPPPDWDPVSQLAEVLPS